MMTIIGSLLGFGTSFCQRFLITSKEGRSKSMNFRECKWRWSLWQRGQSKISELDKEAEIKETEGLYKHDNVDAGGFINALRGSVRPIITMAFLVYLLPLK